MQPSEEPVVIETAEHPEHAVIWLHGLGADGHDFEPLIPELTLTAPRAIRFIFPQAPVQPVTINGGAPMRAWYDIQAADIERTIDLAGLRASSQHVTELLQAQIDQGIPARNIVLAGFSQGGAVAYDAALHFPQALGGLMAFSTYFASQAQSQPEPAQAHLPILIQHGTQDPIVPLLLGQGADEHLRSAGYRVMFQTYPMAHGMCPDQVRDIRHWLASVWSGQF